VTTVPAAEMRHLDGASLDKPTFGTRMGTGSRVPTFVLMAAASVAAATAFRTRLLFISRSGSFETSMIIPSDSSTLTRGSHRAPTHGDLACVRSWTGRAVVSSSTDSIVPRLDTIATHKTRVSEMRSIVRTDRFPAARESSVPVIDALERRMAGTGHAGADGP